MYGTRRCTIDAKLRCTLPSDFRKSIGTNRVVLVPFKNECLYGFAPEVFEEWVLGLFEHDGKKYDDRSVADRTLMRRLRSSAVELTLDSAGRLALGKLDAVDESLRPGQPTRRVRLGIVDDVMIIGNGDRFEIWDANKWLAEQDDGQDPFDFFDVD